MILKNTYVDDIVDSVTTVEHAKRVTEEADQLLKPGGFSIKHLIYSSDEVTVSTNSSETLHGKMEEKESNAIFKESPNEQPETASQKVLGMHWMRNTDDFRFTVRVNFSPRKRKVRTGPNLNLDQIPRELPITLSKRMILSQVNGIYDPMGLATPFTMKAKLLMRQLWSGIEKSLGRDEDIQYLQSRKVNGSSLSKNCLQWKVLSLKERSDQRGQSTTQA